LMGRVSLLDDVCRCARTTQRLSRGMSTPTAGRAGHPAHHAGSRRGHPAPRRVTPGEQTACHTGRAGRWHGAAPGQGMRKGRAAPDLPRRGRTAPGRRECVHRGRATPDRAPRRGAGPRRARPVEAALRTPRPRARAWAARPSQGRHAAAERRTPGPSAEAPRPGGPPSRTHKARWRRREWEKGRERGWAGAVGEDEQGRGGTHPQAAAVLPSAR
jgi:hypothetical protein